MGWGKEPALEDKIKKGSRQRYFHTGMQECITNTAQRPLGFVAGHKLKGWSGGKRRSPMQGSETITWHSVPWWITDGKLTTAGPRDIFWRPFSGWTDRQFGLASTTARAIIEMIEFLLPGERTCPTELGRDRNQGDHKRWEGNGWGGESLKGS